MKLIVFLAVITSSCPLFAAGGSKPPTDPFAGAFFPPELVLLARDRIALTQEQQATLRSSAEKAQSRSEELHTKLQSETAALSALANHDRVDEAALGAQLDKVLDVEREAKHLQIGLLATIKNMLTPEQLAGMREITKDGGAQIKDETRKRLSGKVEQVKDGIQKWSESGRDPSDIGKAMAEKFKPLIEAGNVIDAEAELDSLLEQLNREAK